MNNKVNQMLNFLNLGEFKNMRNQSKPLKVNESLTGFKLLNDAFKKAVSSEKPVFYTSNDVFGFNRYMKFLPKINYAEYSLKGSNNMCVDYAEFLKGGLNGIVNKINEKYSTANATQREFYDACLESIEIAKSVALLYKNEALKLGKTQFYTAVDAIFNGAKTYYEALLSIKYLQYTMRLNLSMHVTLGRFDLYMKPYYDISLSQGLSDDDIKQLTALFFISLNFDCDIYDGIQTGDNGQSLMLGGVDKNGNNVYGRLSEICLEVSEELMLIDPKINLRVNKNTPLSIYEKGTALTKKGLGFPQYSNDDVVIKGLTQIGYDLEDARDYTVAACWEYIIPGLSYEVSNIVGFNLPKVVETTIKNHLLNCQTFEDFEKAYLQELKIETDKTFTEINKYFVEKDAFTSALFPCCINAGKDVSACGAKYNNYGVHGVGISSATDSFYAVKKAVFEDKIVSNKTLLDALNNNFVGYEDLQKTLLSYAKMGDNDTRVDNVAVFIMESYAKNIQGKKNNRGGIVRAGTGSSLEYIRMGNVVGATADGRKAGEPFSANFAPSITAKVKGPISVILSFSKFDMTKLINGGPLTIEMHDTVFRNNDGMQKVAMLVKSYIDRGGHQIQINSINRDRLLDAQLHPENHKNLIVRVWGWSGYFNELDIEYQNHIIKRTEYTF